jgi:cold shock CspA family protein/ribosome-associated translation inhibitor RaiA
MQRPLQITYKGLDRSDSLDALIAKRVDALELLFPRLIGCRVVVEVPHRSAESAKVPIAFSVEVDVPGHNTIVGKDEEERRETKGDQAVALTHAFNAVERQLEKITDQRSASVHGLGANGEAGMIMRLFREQGYGFVQVDNSPELYFTRMNVGGDEFDSLEDGMMVHVTRAMTEGPMGPQASTIRVLNKRMSAE